MKYGGTAVTTVQNDFGKFRFLEENELGLV